jgi:hypothetical protein
MSQVIILTIIKELGGRATSKQIIKELKERYPNDTYHTYSGNRLTRLQKNGSVCYDYKTKEWVAKDYGLLYNRNVVQI